MPFSHLSFLALEAEGRLQPESHNQPNLEENIIQVSNG